MSKLNDIAQLLRQYADDQKPVSKLNVAGRMLAQAIELQPLIQGAAAIELREAVNASLERGGNDRDAMALCQGVAVLSQYASGLSHEPYLRGGVPNNAAIRSDLRRLAQLIEAAAVLEGQAESKTQPREKTRGNQSAKRGSALRDCDARAFLAYCWLCKHWPELMPQSGKTRYTGEMFEHLQTAKADCPFYANRPLPKNRESWATLCRKVQNSAGELTRESLTSVLCDVDPDDIEAVLSPQPDHIDDDPDHARQRTHRAKPGD